MCLAFSFDIVELKLNQPILGVSDHALGGEGGEGQTNSATKPRASFRPSSFPANSAQQSCTTTLPSSCPGVHETQKFSRMFSKATARKSQKSFIERTASSTRSTTSIAWKILHQRSQKASSPAKRRHISRTSSSWRPSA